MSLINSGFDGTVTERDFSRILRGAGVRDSVETVAAWAVTQGTGRQVSVAPGVAYAAGVVSDSGVAILASLPTPTNGQWHLVVRRITWANNTVTVATIPHTTTTTTIPTAPPAGFPVFNDNTGVLVDQHLAWAWVRSTDTAVAVFDLRNVQGVQRTSVVVADFTALALLPAGVRFVGEQAFVVEGDVYMSWTGTIWRQITTARFASAAAQDTAYARAGGIYRVAGVRALDTSTTIESSWTGSLWQSALPGLYALRPTSTGGNGVTVSSDGKVTLVANSANVSVAGVFNQGFDKYLVSVKMQISAATGLNMNIRSGGTVVAAATFRQQRLLSTGASTFSQRPAAGNLYFFGGNNTASTLHDLEFTVNRYPSNVSSFVAVQSTLGTIEIPTGFSTMETTTGSILGAGNFDGFGLFGSGGIFDGTIRVYGYVD